MRDDAVRGSLVGLNTFSTPAVAVVSLWTRQSYARQVRDTVAPLEKECATVAAYLVTESVPLVPPSVKLGARTDKPNGNGQLGFGVLPRHAFGRCPRRTGRRGPR